jgi:hypothetical protein
MAISQEALSFEQQSIGIGGLPTLVKAYGILQNQWNDGDHDREIGLHLLFISWYGLVEPPQYTGFEAGNQEDVWQDLQNTFNLVYAHFQKIIHTDPEMLYVIGLMAYLFPYSLGNEEKWKERSNVYHKMYRTYYPNGITPALFYGRGAYGAYFAHQASIPDSY